MANMNGKVAIITGASSGFGKGTALAFAREGCNLVLNALHEADLKKVADKCTQLGVKTVYQAGDAADEQVAKQTVQLALDTFGRIDVLDNNAGIGEIKTIVDTTMDEFDHIMRTNVRSAYVFTKYVIPTMIKQHDGQIIITSSITGTIGQAGESAYTCSKFALRGLGQAMEQELLPLGIRTTMFLPYTGATNFEVGAGRTKQGVEHSDFLSAEDVGIALVNVCEQPKHARVVELKLASSANMWPGLFRQNIPDDYPEINKNTKTGF